MLAQMAKICEWDQMGQGLQHKLRSLEFGLRPDEVMSPFVLLGLIDDAGLHKRASEAFASCHYKPSSVLGPIPSGNNTDRIRVGYFSADFYNHHNPWRGV